jgi:hypothetical protein
VVRQAAAKDPLMYKRSNAATMILAQLKKIIDPIQERLDKLEALQKAQQRVSEQVEGDLDKRISALEAKSEI